MDDRITRTWTHKQLETAKQPFSKLNVALKPFLLQMCPEGLHPLVFSPFYVEHLVYLSSFKRSARALFDLNKPAARQTGQSLVCTLTQNLIRCWSRFIFVKLFDQKSTFSRPYRERFTEKNQFVTTDEIYLHTSLCKLVSLRVGLCSNSSGQSDWVLTGSTTHRCYSTTLSTTKPTHTLCFQCVSELKVRL